MNPDYANLFLLTDALKRLFAAEFKGEGSQRRAIAEYDSTRARVQKVNPEAFTAFCQAFMVRPDATGADILKGGS
jgi:hypothetical protein